MNYNKTEVTTKIAEKTGLSIQVCEDVLNGLEAVSGDAVLQRIKGSKVNEEAVVQEIAEKSGVSREECLVVLTAFEEVFGEAIDHKFRFFRRKK